MVDFLAAQQNLRDVADMWPLLVVERVPGTPRPWLQTRLRRGGSSSSDSDDPANFVINNVTAPVRLDVLDAMRDCLLWVNRAHRQVEKALALPHRPNPYHDDPIRYLTDLAEWWDDVSEADPTLAEHLADGLAHHHDAIERTLGLALDGKVLPFACPYCSTARSLSITRDEFLGVVIVCTSGACTPPSSSSPHLWRDGRPVWRFAQWSTLAAACERYAGREP
jgi:hypothetical protein